MNVVNRLCGLLVGTALVACSANTHGDGMAGGFGVGGAPSVSHSSSATGVGSFETGVGGGFQPPPVIMRFPAPANPRIEISTIDQSSTPFATFQSHNQKIVANGQGIFVSYLKSSDADGVAQWVLARSMDGGQSFVPIYQATNRTKAPAIDTDAEGNVYLVFPDWGGADAYLYKFSPSNDFAMPVVQATIPGGAAGKYTLLYDPVRNQVYYMTWTKFFALGTDGALRTAKDLLAPGGNAYGQYPHLTIAHSGELVAAWTTVPAEATTNYYYDIHFMASWDGGSSWGHPNGTIFNTPVACDDTGPTLGIVLDDERTKTTRNWLANTLFKGSKIHFFYRAESPARQHYVRYHWYPSPLIDTNVYPKWVGTSVDLVGPDGFFASDAVANTPLYAVSAASNRAVGVLVSYDNGESWLDYAQSSPIAANRAMYALGGARRLSPDGYVLGTYSEYDPEEPTNVLVRLIKIKADMQ